MIVKLARLKLPLTASTIRAVLTTTWPQWDRQGEELIQHLLKSPFMSLPSNIGENSQYAPQRDVPLHSQSQSIDQSSQYSMQPLYPLGMLPSSAPHVSAPNPVTVSSYTIYPFPPLTQYQPGPSSHGGSFSYQDLAYMANASQNNGYVHSFLPPHSTPSSSSFMTTHFHTPHGAPNS
jgi:hypothetical protein